MDRLPPHNRDAERAILGAVLRDNSVLDDVSVGLRVEDFYVYAHTCIFGVMVVARQKGEPIDAVLLAERLKDRIEEIGGYGYLIELWEAAPAARDIRPLVEVVRGYAIRRALINACGEISMRAWELGDTDQLVEDAERSIFAVAQKDLRTEPSSNRAVVNDALEVLDRRIKQAASGEITGAAPYGLADLDAATAGLHNGEVTIIAARPGIGKTIFGCHLADVASAAGVPVLFVSLEQSAVELTLRLLAKHTRINAFKFRRGTITPIERPVIFEVVDELSRAPIWWDDTTSQSIVRIGAQARRMKSKHGIGLVIVDYLQLVAFHDKSMTQNDGLGEISRGLKLMARDLNIPVVALAQLNRESENRGGEPRLSDLRGSGNIEQDADTVILMHPDGDSIKLLIRKNRNGPLCNVVIFHEKEYYRLTNALTP